MVYARPIEGMRVERKGLLNAVAWRRVESTAIVTDTAHVSMVQIPTEQTAMQNGSEQLWRGSCLCTSWPCVKW